MHQLIGSCSLFLSSFLLLLSIFLFISSRKRKKESPKLFAHIKKRLARARLLTPQDAVKWFLFFFSIFLFFLFFCYFILSRRRPSAGIPLVRAVCSGWAQCHVKHLGKSHILCVTTTSTTITRVLQRLQGRKWEGECNRPPLKSSHSVSMVEVSC